MSSSSDIDMSNICVVLGGLARNCANNLRKNLSWMREAIKMFHPDSHFLFITNDSADDTQRILEEFTCDISNTKLYVLDGLSSRFTSRTERLAFCRNLFMNHIHTQLPHHEYAILADLDDILINFEASRLRTCFDPVLTPPRWDVLAAVSYPHYYDMWALRSSRIGLNHDCIDAANHEMMLNSTPRLQAHAKHIHDIKPKFTPTDPPFEVESAFCGLAIYRLSATKGCKYIGSSEACSLGYPPEIFQHFCLKEVCEHVTFHKQMRERNSAHIFIFPPLHFTMTS